MTRMLFAVLKSYFVILDEDAIVESYFCSWFAQQVVHARVVYRSSHGFPRLPVQSRGPCTSVTVITVIARSNLFSKHTQLWIFSPTMLGSRLSVPIDEDHPSRDFNLGQEDDVSTKSSLSGSPRFCEHSTLKKRQQSWVDPFEPRIQDTFYHKNLDTLRPRSVLQSI